MDMSTPQRLVKNPNNASDEVFAKSAVAGDLNKEFEDAYQAAVRRASRVSPRSQMDGRNSHNGMNQEDIVECEDPLDESNILITDPNDDDIGGSSAGGSPKSDPEECDLTPRIDDDDDKELERNDNPSYLDGSSFHPRQSVASSQRVFDEGEVEEDDLAEEEGSPMKNMKAMGHIGHTSFSSYNYNRTEKSSITNRSVRSNSLAKNMRQFTQSCHESELSNKKDGNRSTMLKMQSSIMMNRSSDRSLKPNSFASHSSRFEQLDGTAISDNSRFDPNMLNRPDRVAETQVHHSSFGGGG